MLDSQTPVVASPPIGDIAPEMMESSAPPVIAWSPMASMAALARQEGLSVAEDVAPSDDVSGAEPSANAPAPRKRSARQLLQQTFMAMKALTRPDATPAHLRLRSDASVLVAAMKRQRPWYLRMPSAALDLIEPQRARLARAREAVLDVIDSAIRRWRTGPAGVAAADSELILDQGDSGRPFAVMVGGFVLGIAGWMFASGGKAIEPAPAAPVAMEADSGAAAALPVDSGASLTALEKLTVGVIDERQRIRGTSRTLSTRAVLLAAPSAQALRVGVLPAHSVVSIFPEIAAPVGWVVAQRPDGAIGFVSTLELAGQRDPALDGPAAIGAARPRAQAAARAIPGSRGASRGRAPLSADDLMASQARRR